MAVIEIPAPQMEIPVSVVQLSSGERLRFFLRKHGSNELLPPDVKVAVEIGYFHPNGAGITVTWRLYRVSLATNLSVLVGQTTEGAKLYKTFRIVRIETDNIQDISKGILFEVQPTIVGASSVHVLSLVSETYSYV